MTQGILDRYLAQESNLLGQTILAPVLPHGRVATRLSSGAIYTFRVTGYTGWGVFQPRNAQQLQVIRDAEQWERLMYLRVLPALRCILVSPLHSGTWLAVPWSLSDARQRRLPEAFSVHYVTQGQAFDRIVARWDGQTAWWECGDGRDTQPWKANKMRDALSNLAPVPSELTPEQGIAYSIQLEKEKEARVTKEERAMRSELSHLGARFTNFEQYGSGYIVRFEDRGERHEIRVNAGLGVTSAGICLSGRDSDFDLASIVGVLRIRGRNDDDNW